jgi:cytochrome P450
MADYPMLEVDLSRKVGPPTSHFEEIDELRERYRWFWNTEAQGYWVLTRYADIREAFQTPEVFGNHSIVAVDPDPAYRFLPSYTDPPQHMKYRSPLNRWFSPKAVSDLIPTIRAHAGRLIDGLVATGRTDFMTSIGDQLPALTFASAVRLPETDVPFLINCANRISGSVTAVGLDPVGAMNDIKAYFADLVRDREKKRLDPAEDFLTHLMGVTIDDRPIESEELLDICMTLAFGSLDTTKSVLGWCFWHLASHPYDRQWVVKDPTIIPSAVEEFLRAYPIVSMARKAKQDVDFHGCPIKAGDMVLLSIQSATRDPEVFTDPQEVRLDRAPNRHIAFGASEHRCLGSHLARAELRIAIEEWHQRIPDYRLPSDQQVLAHGGQISLLTLPLEWDPSVPDGSHSQRSS